MPFLRANALQMPLHVSPCAGAGMAVREESTQQNQDAQQPRERNHRCNAGHMQASTCCSSNYIAEPYQRQPRKFPTPSAIGL
jgi:hypothetical protein